MIMRENKSPRHKREKAKRLSTKSAGTDNQKNVNLHKSRSAHGMKVGYHSGATNPSGHSNRLHKADRLYRDPHK
jgi:hypothetical protein